MYRKMIGVVLCVFVFALAAGAQQDQHLGTWTLNLAKSKYSPGPPPRSGMITFAPYGNGGIKFTFEQINAEGNKTSTAYSGNFDGKQVPYVQTPPPATGGGQTVALKRVDRNTFERTTYLAGKQLTTVRFVVSPDGKTLTATQTGTNAAGQAINNTTVYDKQ
jgi:hypothetical protein